MQAKQEFPLVDPFMAYLIVKWAIALGLLVIASMIAMSFGRKGR